MNLNWRYTRLGLTIQIPQKYYSWPGFGFIVVLDRSILNAPVSHSAAAFESIRRV